LQRRYSEAIAIQKFLLGSSQPILALERMLNQRIGLCYIG
jgi:hypothetical protein